MLNKVLVMTIVSAVLNIARVFLPELPISDELAAQAVDVVFAVLAAFGVGAAGYAVRESALKVAKLNLKD